MATAKGFKSEFIDSKKSLIVNLPKLSSSMKMDLAPVGQSGVLDYTHFALVLSKKRRFPFYTATNIDGDKFVKIKRADVFPSGRDEWKEDKRAKGHQWGQKLYDAPKSYFDRGHMTKREDPQWGSSKAIARKAFRFTNCIPQLADLNQKIWGNLETYILTKQSIPNKLRICLFTGPVLSSNDPEFVTKVNGEAVQLPTLFWKVIYYTNDGKTLSRAAFIMGQEDLLVSRGIAVPKVSMRTLDTFFLTVPNYFMDYEDAETYQINIRTVEMLSGLTFHKAKDPYKDNRPIKLIKKAVQVTGRNLLYDASKGSDLTLPDFRITNIKL